MELYKRKLISELRSRLDEQPRTLIFVVGPRQSGKTTLVLQTLAELKKKTRYIAAEESIIESIHQFPPANNSNVAPTGKEGLQWLIENWQLARADASSSSEGAVLVVDEVQKIPGWSEVVKGLWDKDRQHNLNLHVVLLGSAPLDIDKGVSESLTGRFEKIRNLHWSYTEMHEAFNFDLNKYIYFGGFPGAIPFFNDRKRWRNYIYDSIVDTTINRDILAFTRINKPALFKQLFELAVEYSGQIVAYHKLLGQLQDAGNTTTLAHYLELFSKAGLVTGLSNYSGSAVRRKRTTPKLIVLNTGFMSFQSKYTYEEAQADRTYWGRLVESTVGAHLFNTGPPFVDVYYWRHEGYEVDFVLQRGKKLVPIEVKSGPSRRISGINEFKRLYKSTTGSIVVGEGGIPLADFLSQSAEDWVEFS